jgi:hypothetical protein
LEVQRSYCDGVSEFTVSCEWLWDNKNKSKQQTKTNKLARVVPNNEPKTHKTLGKPTVRWYLTILLKLNTLQYRKYTATNNANAKNWQQYQNDNH